MATYLDELKAVTAGSHAPTKPSDDDMGRAFYLAMYENDGAKWEANEHKDIWIAKAQRYRELLQPATNPDGKMPPGFSGKIVNRNTERLHKSDQDQRGRHHPDVEAIITARHMRAENVRFPAIQSTEEIWNAAIEAAAALAQWGDVAAEIRKLKR